MPEIGRYRIVSQGGAFYIFDEEGVYLAGPFQSSLDAAWTKSRMMRADRQNAEAE